MIKQNTKDRAEAKRARKLLKNLILDIQTGDDICPYWELFNFALKTLDKLGMTDTSLELQAAWEKVQQATDEAIQEQILDSPF